MMEDNKINIEGDFVNNKATKGEKEKLMAKGKNMKGNINEKIFRDNIKKTINILNNIAVYKENQEDREDREGEER